MSRKSAVMTAMMLANVALGYMAGAHPIAMAAIGFVLGLWTATAVDEWLSGQDK